MSVSRRRATKDDRVTIKIDKDLWHAIDVRIKEHPEWGMRSVSDFIRRAVDRELEYRSGSFDKKIIEIALKPAASQEDSRSRGP